MEPIHALPVSAGPVVPGGDDKQQLAKSQARRLRADSQGPPLLPGRGGPSGLVTNTAVSPLCRLGGGDREALSVTSSLLNLAKLQIQGRVS